MDISLFQKIKVLGEGTFGKCYLVNNKSNNQLCVLKQIDMNGMNDKQKQDTMKQARILQALDHPSIIKFIGSFKSRGGYLNIVMNYADGGDMAKAIKQAKGVYFTENQILNWFTQICLAVRHIHDRKIIHRDIKCENIFLTKDKIVKLGDFGIAKSLKQTIEKLKSVVGTPYYMSPEICENKDYSFKTDIWSLGVILYELCALKPPFEANSLAALALRILKGQYPPLPNYYSKQLRKLIAQILTVDASKRPSITQILKNPLITSRIANYIEKNMLIREPSICTLKEIGDEVSVSKKARVGSLFSPQNVPCGQSPTLFPVQTPQNKNISISAKFKQNSSYQKNQQKDKEGDKHTRRAMRRRQNSQPNLTAKLLYNNMDRFRRNNFASNAHLQKKRSDDSAVSRKPRRKKQQEPNSNNILMQLEEIKEINSQVRQLHQQVETIDRQLTARHEPEQEDKYFTEYPIEQLEEILYQEDDDEEVEGDLAKELELKKTYNVIMKKYEGTEDQVDFSYETQEETLRALIQGKIGQDKTAKVIDIVRKGKGFPLEQMLDGILTREEQKEIVPLTAIYYYYVECE